MVNNPKAIDFWQVADALFANYSVGFVLFLVVFL